MRRALIGACLLLGCARTAPEEAATIPEPARAPEISSAPETPEPTADPLQEVSAIVEATKIDLEYLSDDEIEQLAAAGLTPQLATEALEVLARRCKDRRTPTCGHSGHEKQLREALVEWMRERGDLSSAPVLLRLDHYGDTMAGLALDDALTRRMQATLRPCAPPSEAEIAAARADLTSFVVLEHRRGRLQGRAATEAELDDLAYFLAAVAENGAPAGEQVDTQRSGVTPTADELRQRKLRLDSLDHAAQTGDHALTVQAGSDYLHMLGYPGAIDLSREPEMFWGGARFSYVMRDVARAAELEGEHALAASLYRRANPGGGACGTSVSGRLSDQIEGLIRSEEAQGRCRAAVAERLTNREGTADSPYGPGRLAEAGYDLARLYRGALVTRHRDREPSEVEAAIGRAPEAVREAGLARLTARGPEAWEARVWATEGMVDEAGRAGVDHLMPLVDRADPELRARMISAIGRGGERSFTGPCETRGWGSLGLSGSNIWSRRVGSFGHDCSTWLTDDEANAMARQLLPHLRDRAPAVRQATAEALGHLAAPIARRPLRQAQRRGESASERCKAKEGEECWPLREAADATREALEELTAAENNRQVDPLANGWTEDG